ncbi:MAG: DUF4126 domain-containing protein [Verrucomicrobiota bacterium]
MAELEMIAVAFSLSALAGLNLYLTVFVLGLSLRMDWITLGHQFEALSLLENPTILILSGFFFLIEFFADKIPWVDSLWDAIHTVVRPIGATFLALGVLGDLDPTLAVIASILGGSMALLTHLTKSGARLLLNTSPEPFSNSVVSVGEDLTVIGGLALIYTFPWVAAICLVLFLAVIGWFLPNLSRRIWVTGLFLKSKLSSVGSPEEKVDHLPTLVPDPVKERLSEHWNDHWEAIWITPVVTAPKTVLPPHRNAYLLAVKLPDQPDEGIQIVILTRDLSKCFVMPLAQLAFKATYRILFDELELHQEAKKESKLKIRFFKHQQAYLKAVLQWAHEAHFPAHYVESDA